MGKPTGKTGAWQELRKCKALSPAKADALFFPGAGAKVNKARSFCETCPVIDRCLQEALKLKLIGFWAGTTDDERAMMRDVIASMPINVRDYLPASLRAREDNQIKGVERRPVQPAVNKTQSWNPLDEVEGPTEEELRELA